MSVFSAHAEVVPILLTLDILSIRILRARGGSSGKKVSNNTGKAYSPRTRR